MTVIVDAVVPADAFALGELFDEHPSIRIEFERLIPVGGEVVPYVWVFGGDPAAVEASLAELPELESLRRVTATDGGTLIEMTWASDLDGLVAGIRESNCRLVDATGTADGWRLQLRFDERDDVLSFNRRFTENGVPVTTTRIADLSDGADHWVLTTAQGEAVRLASQYGYFAVPRECGIDDLADEAGISTSAFSERLRRGVSKVIEQSDFSTGHFT